MIIYLNPSSTTDQGNLTLNISERLPAYVEDAFSIYSEYQIQAVSDYFLLTYSAASPINVVCQRCLRPFSYHYQNTLTLALCPSEERANALMDQYECLIVQKNQVDLLQLVTDDLHLYVPENHLNPEDCDPEVSKFIKNESEKLF